MDNLHPVGVVTPPSLGGRESLLLPLAALQLLGAGSHGAGGPPSGGHGGGDDREDRG